MTADDAEEPHASDGDESPDPVDATSPAVPAVLFAVALLAVLILAVL